MKTLQNIVQSITDPSMLDDLADLLRNHEPEFAQTEEEYHAAVEELRSKLTTNASPSVDEYVNACKTEVVANLLYAGYLGYRANLENFHAPYTTSFVAMDFTDYIRDHLMGHFPASYTAVATKDRFYESLPETLKETISPISSYFIYLDTAGPKFAHYAGYVIANHFLPWVEPGYREDYAQTYRYGAEMKKYMGYLPL